MKDSSQRLGLGPCKQSDPSCALAMSPARGQTNSYVRLRARAASGHNERIRYLCRLATYAIQAVSAKGLRQDTTTPRSKPQLSILKSLP